MPRGGQPMALESLVPYFRGARFAALAMKRRHEEHDPDLSADADRYVEMVDGYSEAALATFRLKRERSAGDRGGRESAG